jgi:hypothetical protein
MTDIIEQLLKLSESAKSTKWHFDSRGNYEMAASADGEARAYKKAADIVEKSASPITHIVTDANGQPTADTLPPDHTRIIAHCRGGEVSDVQHMTAGRFLYTDDNVEVSGVYAWQFWPDPAPYPGGEQ